MNEKPDMLARIIESFAGKEFWAVSLSGEGWEQIEHEVYELSIEAPGLKYLLCEEIDFLDEFITLINPVSRDGKIAAETTIGFQSKHVKFLFNTKSADEIKKFATGFQAPASP